MLVHIDALGSRHFGQAGQGHNIAGQRHGKAGAGGDLHIAHGDAEALGTTFFFWSSDEGILGLGHADRHLGKAQFFESA